MGSAYEGAVNGLGVRIVSGDLVPGDSLTLEQLCQDEEVSRTIAREAVQVLASMGLVQSRRRTGITVLPRERWDVFDPAVVRWRLGLEQRREHLAELSQLRAAVEPTACGLAAVHASEEVRAELVDLAARMEDTGAAGDLRAFLELDVRFHRLLLQSSGNSMFARLGDVVEEVLRGRTDHHLMPPRPKPEARRLHSMVADAVRDGNAEVARSAMSTICLEVAADVAPSRGR